MVDTFVNLNIEFCRQTTKHNNPNLPTTPWTLSLPTRFTFKIEILGDRSHSVFWSWIFMHSAKSASTTWCFQSLVVAYHTLWKKCIGSLVHFAPRCCVSYTLQRVYWGFGALSALCPRTLSVLQALQTIGILEGSPQLLLFSLIKGKVT